MAPPPQEHERHGQRGHRRRATAAHVDASASTEAPRRWSGAALALLVALVAQSTAHGLVRAHGTRGVCDPVLLLAAEVLKGLLAAGGWWWCVRAASYRRVPVSDVDAARQLVDGLDEEVGDDDDEDGKDDEAAALALVSEPAPPSSPSCGWCDFDAWGRAAVPGAVYCLMNVISMKCTPYVSATFFAVLMQLKLVFTAAFSWACLGTTYTRPRLLSIALVLCGTIALVLADDDGRRRPPSPVATEGEDAAAPPHPPRVALASDPDAWRAWAVVGLVGETMLSGLTTVYMQRMLARDAASPAALCWRNVQLAVIGSLLLLDGVWNEDACTTSWRQVGLNDVAVVGLAAAGGALVALTLVSAGGIDKCVATCLSVALTAIVEALVWTNEFTPLQGVLAAVVALAVAQYGATAPTGPR